MIINPLSLPWKRSNYDPIISIIKNLGEMASGKKLGGIVGKKIVVAFYCMREEYIFIKKHYAYSSLFECLNISI